MTADFDIGHEAQRFRLENQPVVKRNAKTVWVRIVTRNTLPHGFVIQRHVAKHRVVFHDAA